MSRVGLDWYKREPVAYLGDVQGLTSKEHAVYSVVIDLLYVHGGAIRNDPKWIAGWISDMGSSSVRKALASLEANPRITIEVTNDEISQNRAKTEAKTKQNLRETAQKHGKIGGEKSAELRRQPKENNSLAVADPSTEIQPEKIRLDKSIKRVTNVTLVPSVRFDEFWNTFPHRNGAKKGKHSAKLKYEAQLKAGASEEIIIQGAIRYASDRQVIDGYGKGPTPWLNQKCWNDDIEIGARNNGNGNHNDPTLESIARAARAR